MRVNVTLVSFQNRHLSQPAQEESSEKSNLKPLHHVDTSVNHVENAQETHSSLCCVESPKHSVIPTQLLKFWKPPKSASGEVHLRWTFRFIQSSPEPCGNLLTRWHTLEELQLTQVFARRPEDQRKYSVENQKETNDTMTESNGPGSGPAIKDSSFAVDWTQRIVDQQISRKI